MAGVKKEAPKEAKKAPKSEAKKEETPKASAKESKKSDKKATFLVLPCSCEHEFQDARYGVKQRAHNPTGKGSRCTVCGANKS